MPYSADLMYGIVADVERYPEFVPWCAGLRVLERGREAGRDYMIAETRIGYRSLREQYKSLVWLDPAQRMIDVTQTEGPFRRLENHWRFTPSAPGCRVQFSIAFEFKSRVLGMVAAAALGPVMARMTDAFEGRARVLSRKGKP